MTYTVLGFCERTGRLGVGIATYSLAVGAKCPGVRSATGAVASQAFSNPRLARLALNSLEAGHNAASALAVALASDDFPDHRQVAVLDRNGRGAAHSGGGIRPWFGHRVEEGCVAMGNVLVGPAVVDAIAETFLRTRGEDLADRLLAAIEAGRDAGGQRGGAGHLPERSAGLLVHHRDEHPEIDLRVDFHGQAVEELRRIYDEYKLYLPLYQIRATDPPKAPPQEVYVAELEAKRARKGGAA